MPIVLLVRHGRTTANATGILAGWAPGVGLDEVGAAAATEVGHRLAEAGMPVARLVSSPLPRCLATAEAIRQELGPVEVTTHDGLAECRYGSWSGQPLAELAKDPLWKVVQEQPSAVRFPDGELPGESMASMAARAIAAIREVDAEVAHAHGESAVWVAVSHGDVIKAILADAAGCHLDAFQRFVVDPASLSAVRYTPARPYVLRVNDTGGNLASLVPKAPDATAEADAATTSHDAVVGGGAG
ncbi:MAG: MSMEG_4193 family putative phosphomutase [Dermatophilaceae bacterium]|nr:MSMEG_4193 family putative phosphomutase [Dermatophilaceae bacterium]